MGKEKFIPKQKEAIGEGGIKSKLDIDFEELLAERNKLKERKVLGDLQINELLMLGGPEQLSDEGVKQGWTRVVERVTQETKALDSLRETGVIYGLVSGLENGKYQVPVRFVEEGGKEEMGKLKEQPFSDESNLAVVTGEQGKRRIYIKGSAPNKRKMWFDTASLGRLPGEVGSLQHELVHVLQWPEEKIKRLNKRLSTQLLISDLLFGIGFISGLYKIHEEEERCRVLEEIHSFKAGDIVDRLKERSTLELVEHLQGAYNFHEIDIMVTGITEIERLRALGLDDKEVGKLIGLAKWDKKTVTFPLLEKEIERIAGEKGLSIDDVDNLVLARRMQREIEREKARIIAQEELVNLASN